MDNSNTVSTGRYFISKAGIDMYNSVLKEKDSFRVWTRRTIFSHTHVFNDGNMMTIQIVAGKKRHELVMSFKDYMFQELIGKKVIPKTINGEYRFILSSTGKEYAFYIEEKKE